MNLHIEARVCVHCLLASQFLLVISELYVRMHAYMQTQSV